MRTAKERRYRELDDQAREAQNKVNELRRDMEAESDAKIRLFVQTLDISVEADRLAVERNAAKEAMIKEREDAALAGKDAPFPLGTKLRRKQGFTFSHEPSKFVYGVVEAVTRETQFPVNMASYNKPKPGDFIIRILKNDGTPSLKMETSFLNWHEIPQQTKEQTA